MGSKNRFVLIARKETFKAARSSPSTQKRILRPRGKNNTRAEFSFQSTDTFTAESKYRSGWGESSGN